MSLKKFFNLIHNKDIGELKTIKFEDGTSLEEFCITDPSELPIPLRSPEQMLFTRELAIRFSPNDSFNSDLKGKWQRYWLRCCISDECNYFFAVFKELGINREDDLEIIMKDKYLWQVVGSQDGINFYKRTIADWFLRRYNRKTAKSILNTISDLKRCEKCFDNIRLYYPRLIIAILVGFLPLIVKETLWKMSINLWDLWKLKAGIIPVVLLGLSYVYMVYECNKLINDIGEARKRASRTCGYGLLMSMFFSSAICLSIGPAVLTERVSKAGNISYILYLLELLKAFWQDIVFFAFAALFIGIFLQVFWQEKTATEPL